MSTKNLVLLTGNVGKSELKYLSNGSAMLDFSIATNESYKKDGEKHEIVTWHNCQIWGKRAESLSTYIVKGMLIQVSGSYRHNEYEEKDSGKMRKYYFVNATDVSFLGGGNKTQNQAKPQAQQAGVDKSQFDLKIPNFNTDDIPF